MATKHIKTMNTSQQLDDRREWADEANRRMRGRCMGCGRKPQRQLHVHEIERRAHSPRWAARCNYLLLCQECHAFSFDCMGHSRQLAHKMICDPEHYDLQQWLRIRDPERLAPQRVVQAEVDAWLEHA